MSEKNDIFRNGSDSYNVSERSQPVRILCVVTQMNRAGLESRFMDIYRNLDGSIIQFDFYTCRKDEGQFDKEIISLGGRIYYNEPLVLNKFYAIPNRFFDFLKNHPEYSIIHAHMNHWCGLILMGAKKAGVAVRIAHSRTALEKFTIKNMAKNILKVITKHYATHFFAVSKKAGVWLYGKRAVNNGKVQVWPNAIECKKYLFNIDLRTEVRKELHLSDEFTILHVGNIRPEKNHTFLLEVFKEILEKKNDSKLILVGEDCSSGDCKRLAQKMGIHEKVLFLGSRDDVNRILQAGDVFVFPSLYEGLPGAVLEAQAASLPCFISDTITDEVCISPYVKRLSLSLGAKKWSEYILGLIDGNKMCRSDSYDYFRKTGFDAYSLANKLSGFYLESIEKKGV